MSGGDRPPPIFEGDNFHH
jgi:hypothetical protein